MAVLDDSFSLKIAKAEKTLIPTKMYPKHKTICNDNQNISNFLHRLAKV
jgi:hypothetical protein